MSASEKAAASVAQQPAASSPDRPQLRRILGMRDLVLLIIGTVIGSGIFLVPGTILKSVGNSLPVALRYGSLVECSRCSGPLPMAN